MTVPLHAGSGSEPAAGAAHAGLWQVLQQRAAGLAHAGYRTDDARFLVAAALTGGYFVRRQYRMFTGCRAGSRETGMLRRATVNGHVVAAVGKSLYRIVPAPLRRAVGDDTVIPVPGRAWRAVRQALITLDYLLAAGLPGDWLLAESDKTRHFSSLDIPAERFPVAARSRKGQPRPFPEAFPLHVIRGERPLVSFCHAPSGTGTTGLLRHLARHAALACELRRRSIDCEWVMLADSPGQFPRIRAAWRRWREGRLRDWNEREYFALRRAVERRRWADLSGAAVDRYADLRARHAGPGPERRYARWIEDGCPSREPGADFASVCGYREFLLDHDYSIAERVER